MKQSRAAGLPALLALLAALGCARHVAQAPQSPSPDAAAPREKAGLEEEEAVPPISDPLEPLNRVFFAFNDRLYFWVLRPTAKGYKFVVPQCARVGVRNFFSNLGAPSRGINCLLQGDLRGTGTELARFAANSTIGILGFSDPAKSWLKLRIRSEDFGQTLGVWGFGMGAYSQFPFLNPSCVRDNLGWIVDMVLDPLTNVPVVNLPARINSLSLTLGEYEDLKKAALDPYVAVRDAYNQHRRHATRSWD